MVSLPIQPWLSRSITCSRPLKNRLPSFVVWKWPTAAKPGSAISTQQKRRATQGSSVLNPIGFSSKEMLFVFSSSCYNHLRGWQQKQRAKNMKTLRWNSRDLEAMPEDGKRYEIVDGELYVSKQPHWQHPFVCGRVFALLD